MKMLLPKILLLLMALPVKLFAQDITGVWKGELYVDSTKKYLPYEISISEVKGRLIGYSYIVFEENGKQETGTRDIIIQRKDDEITIEDVSLIDNSFSFVPPKNIKKTMVVTLSGQDTAMMLKGNWSTNKTRRFLSATGTVIMQRKDDFKNTVLFKKLEDLKLTDKLIFNGADQPLAPIANATASTIEVIPKAAASINTIKVNKSIPAIVFTTKPVEIKSTVRPVTKAIQIKPTPPPAIAVATKPVEVKKILPAITKPATPKPAQAPMAAVVKKPEIKVPAVVKQPAVVPAIAAPPVEKQVLPAPEATNKDVPVMLPSAAAGAAEVSKRTNATMQSVFYQSDSLVLTLYDNGYVDGDTVSVVMNGAVIFSKQGLSTVPVSKTIYINKQTPDSIMLIMYAENLGSIPPNTGLLVVHDGEAIYDVRFSADLKTNAAISLKEKSRNTLLMEEKMKGLQSQKIAPQWQGIEPVKLTQYSHGAGCGCKIAPNLLEEILAGAFATPDDNNLLVGNHSKDDAAVYDLGNGTALISTTDFFMPIVDDPYEFGRIASANAISDVYAMGGKPVLAIAILGWPVNMLPAAIAQKVIEGSRSICKEAGISLAGGHSIDSPEPIFGLAVNGLVPIENIKQNNLAREGDLLFLTKPLGVGILTTAEKKGLLKEEHKGVAAKQMMQLNKAGEALGKVKGIHAMTDITGFGLLGHLVEMAEGSGLSALIHFEKLPFITSDLNSYVDKKCVPGGTHRNWDSYGDKISQVTDHQKAILADPQTSGGLLIAASVDAVEEVKIILEQYGLQNFTGAIGSVTAKMQKVVTIH